jgi:hypothetical protein
MTDFGRILVIIGFAVAFAGGIILLAARYFPWLGNLPGDFRWESDNVSFFFPLATMILISIIGSIILNVVLRIFRR